MLTAPQETYPLTLATKRAVRKRPSHPCLWFSGYMAGYSVDGPHMSFFQGLEGGICLIQSSTGYTGEAEEPSGHAHLG